MQYKALVLSKADPHRPADQTYTLKHHPTAPSEADPNKFEEIPIECCEDSLIYQCKQEQPKLMICVTMYNEPYSQLVQSLAGLYRAYYELVHWDEDFRNKVHIVIVIDGYDRINRETLEKMERAGIYSAFETAPYVSAELTSDKAKHFIKFKSKFGSINLYRPKLYQLRNNEDRSERRAIKCKVRHE